MPVRQYGRESKASSNRSVTEQALSARHDLVNYVREYARQNPEATALWCLGVGFLLGWKLKPW